MEVQGRLCRRTFPIPALLPLLLTLIWSTFSTAAETKVVELEIDGPIGVATADYLNSGIEHAEDIGAELVIISMDTPGGLMKPMREIVQVILASTVPVATYVTPAGARADSAGTYILLACHVAAMTPTTHLGAATPVPLVNGAAEDDKDDGKADSAMDRKVMNDAVSYIRSLADRHGRNADWAESAVTEAATLTAAEALEQNVIDFVASDREELLTLINGHEIEVAGKTRVLSTSDAEIEVFKPNWRIRLLTVISNPEIVLLLGLIGLYGLMYEGWNPGAIVPGVVGAICLLLAAYALQVLPVNYAGLALMLLGVALMIAEGFAPSFGILGLGGVAAFVFGSIILMDSDVPGFQIARGLIGGIAAAGGLAALGLIIMLMRIRRRPVVSGVEGMVGDIGEALETFTDGTGTIFVDGERWQAYAQQPVAKGDRVTVTRVSGLTVDVAPATQR